MGFESTITAEAQEVRKMIIETKPTNFFIADFFPKNNQPFTGRLRGVIKMATFVKKQVAVGLSICHFLSEKGGLAQPLLNQAGTISVLNI